MARIFLVEDNESIREAVASYLKLDEHEVVEFAGVADVLEVMAHKAPDLLVLDVMLPDGNGFALAKKIRASSGVPLIFLTAREKESDRITGFELGADDYVVKPFSPKELVLRVNAVLKRSRREEAPAEASEAWVLGERTLQLAPAGHRALLDGSALDLTSAEWKILQYLSANPGIVLSREKILGECLGYSFEGSERTIDTHIKNLRAKLADPDWIQTVRSYGYRFSGTPKGA